MYQLINISRKEHKLVFHENSKVLNKNHNFFVEKKFHVNLVVALSLVVKKLHVLRKLPS